MKLLIHLLIVISSCSTSCNNQEIDKTVIKYYAQTRGFLYSLNFEKNALEINENGKIRKVILNKKQVDKIDSLLLNIDFTKIENNLVKADLAVDKTIKGTLEISLEKKLINFEFDHNNLPEVIKNLFNQLETFKN